MPKTGNLSSRPAAVLLLALVLALLLSVAVEAGRTGRHRQLQSNMYNNRERLRFRTAVTPPRSGDKVYSQLGDDVNEEIPESGSSPHEDVKPPRAPRQEQLQQTYIDGTLDQPNVELPPPVEG